MATFVRISEASSLALHTMVLLAHEPDRRWTNQQIAERLQVSNHHLAKVMARLARDGLVHSSVGPRGGFQLAKPADQIRLLDIHEAVEGPVGESDCLLGNRPCNRSECLLSEMIQSVHEQVRTYLRETTLEQLARRVGFLSWEGSDP